MPCALKALGVAEVFTPKDFGLNDIMVRFVEVIRASRGLDADTRRPPTPERGRARSARVASGVDGRDRAAVSSRVKAGMSSGLRLVIRLSSTTTSRSSQVAPALRRSVCRLGHEVRCGRARRRPR